MNGLVVVGLVGLAASFLLVDVIPPRSQTDGRMATLKRSILAYVAKNHAIPKSLDDLAAAGEDPPLNRDGWGRPIILRVEPNGMLSLISLGADGKPGGSGQDADMIGTFDPNKRYGDWHVDPFGRRPTTDPFDGVFDPERPSRLVPHPELIRGSTQRAATRPRCLGAVTPYRTATPVRSVLTAINLPPGPTDVGFRTGCRPHEF